MRGLYAYQKYMSYALEVSDKIFEGGTAGATEDSLRRLKNSGLSDEEISRLSDYTANRRTFKDATWTDEQGRTRGSDRRALRIAAWQWQCRRHAEAVDFRWVQFGARAVH